MIGKETVGFTKNRGAREKGKWEEIVSARLRGGYGSHGTKESI